MTLFQELIKEDKKERDKLQKQLLLEIQRLSKRKTIAYLANFKNSPHNMINGEDKSAIDMLINSLPPQTKAIDFILHSPGGFAEDTERWYMLQNLEAKERRRVAAKIDNYFSDQAKHLTHRRPISRKEAESQGVVIQEIEKNKDFAESV